VSAEPPLRLAVDVAVCIGAGRCTTTAPRVFTQRDDGLVALLQDGPADAADRADARTAVQLCPAGAIRVLTPHPG
jgi:ferredoxin